MLIHPMASSRAEMAVQRAAATLAVVMLGVVVAKESPAVGEFAPALSSHHSVRE